MDGSTRNVLRMAATANDRETMGYPLDCTIVKNVWEHVDAPSKNWRLQGVTTTPTTPRESESSHTIRIFHPTR